MEEIFGLLLLFAIVIIVVLIIMVIKYFTYYKPKRFIERLCNILDLKEKVFNKYYYTFMIFTIVISGEKDKHHISIKCESKRKYNKEENDYINYIPLTVDIRSVVNYNIVFCTDNIQLKQDKEDYYDLIIDILSYCDKITVAYLSNKETISIINTMLKNNIKIIIQKDLIQLKWEEGNNYSKDNLLIFKDAVDKALSVSNKIITNKFEEDILITNINNEKNIDLRIINLKHILFSNNINKYHDFLNKLKNDRSRLISYIALIGLNVDIDVNINLLLESNNINALLFVLEYIRFNYKKSNYSKILIDIIYKADNLNIIKKILDVLKKYKDQNIDYKGIIEYLTDKFYSDNYQVKLIIIDFLNETNAKEGIDWLIKQLNEEHEILIKAITSLGNLGKINAVQHLLPLTKGLQNPNDIKNAVRKAIQQIQKNIPENQKGDLTLTEIEKAGELSLDNIKGNGNLSVKEED